MVNNELIKLVCNNCGMEQTNCKCTISICEMEDCPHCAYERQQEYEADLEKEAAIDFAKWIAQDWMSMWVEGKWLWECQTMTDNKEYQGYKTEEELYQLYLKY